MRCGDCKHVKRTEGKETTFFCKHPSLGIQVDWDFGCKFFLHSATETLEEGAYVICYWTPDDLGRVINFIQNNAPKGDIDLLHQALYLLSQPRLYSFSIYAKESILSYNFKMNQLKLRVMVEPVKENGEGESNGA